MHTAVYCRAWIPGRRKRVTPSIDEVAEVKGELIETARALLREGLVEGTSGNLSSRLPGGHIVMSPASLEYEEMTPDDLVVIDLEGHVIQGERTPTSEKALHLACLRAYEEVGAVIHSHAKYATMFAVAHQPIPCVIEEFSIFVGGVVPVAAYQVAGSDALGEEVARHLKDRSAVLMANHGLLAVGKDLKQAHKVTGLVERTAEIIWGARALGQLVPLPEETLDRFASSYERMRQS
ncbi:MAG: fuculose phosphate aldolase [bacterium]|nr:fuculose phosphate aldolase [bacterium]MCP5071285.1 fuculose phosphate aldolase [bacterium]